MLGNEISAVSNVCQQSLDRSISAPSLGRSSELRCSSTTSLLHEEAWYQIKCYYSHIYAWISGYHRSRAIHP